MPKVLADQIFDTLQEAQQCFSQEARTTEALLWLKQIEENKVVLPPLVRDFFVRILTTKEISAEDRQFIEQNKVVLRNILEYLKNLTKSSFGGSTVGTVTPYAPYGDSHKGYKSGQGKPQR